MTRPEAKAFNAGVLAVLAIADKSARAIQSTSRRPLVEGFAVAALAEPILHAIRKHEAHLAREAGK